MDTRIASLRTYLIGILNSLTTKEYDFNVNMLSNDPNNYSLDRLPLENEVTKWIIGTKIKRDAYTFRARFNISQDLANNLNNIGFFEQFEEAIETNNEKGILPNIEDIKSIECLNGGTLNWCDTNTAEYDIQIQITYYDKWKEKQVSL